MRRNFIRFGKRSGIVVDHPNEMEEDENLKKFLDFFKHFEFVPVQDDIYKEKEWSPVKEEFLHQPVNHLKKRARDFIRFGKRSPEVGYEYFDEHEMFDYPDEVKKWMLKRSPKRRKMANHLRFGRK